MEIKAKNSEAIAAFKETAAEANKMAAEATAAGEKSNASFQKMQGISKAAFLATAGVMAVVGVESIKMAAEFQESTSKLAGNAQISTDAANNIGKAFLSTAGKSTFSGQTMVNAYGPVARQLASVEGHALSSSDALKVMTAASDLAEASGGDLASTTSTLAVVMQSYHLGATDAAEASNTLFNASTILNTPLADVANAVDKLHGRLGVAAPSLADTSALMVDLGQHGVTGSRGLMVVQTAMSTLLGGAKPVNDELKSLGVSIFDSNGKFIGMKEAMAKLSPALAGLTDEQKALAEKNLFGAGAAGVMNGVMSGGVKSFEAASAAVEKHGAVESAAERNAHTFGGQLKTLWATCQDLGVTIGAVLLPPVQGALAGFLGLFNFLKANTPIAITLGVVVGGLAVGLSSLYVITKTVTLVQSAWAMGTKAAAGAQWLLNAAMDANPIGIVIVILGALVAGVVIAYNKLGWFKDGVNAVWTGIKNVTGSVWDFIKTYVIGGWILEFQILGNAGIFLWKNVFIPVWDGIKYASNTTWQWINNNVFSPFKLGITAIGIAFDQTQKFIGTAWGKVKDAAAAPVRWIVDTVYTNGIEKVWNGIAGAVGLNLKLPNVSAGFADGGIYGTRPGYTPGRDTHLIAVSGGEAIMRPEWARAIGTDGVNQMNRMAKSGGVSAIRKAMGYADGGIAGYADGGVLNGIGSFLGGIGHAIGTAVSDVAHFVSDPIGTITSLIVAPIKAMQSMAPGGRFGQLAFQLPINVVDGLGDEAKKLLGAITGGGGSPGGGGGNAAAGVQQWAPDVLRALAMVGQPASLLQTTLRRMNQESGGNPNAINNWDSNAVAGDPSRGLMQTIGSTFAAYAMPGYNTNIYDPMSNILASMRYAISRYGSLAAAYNQAGGYSLGGTVPVFDQGGWVPPGRSMIDNRTGGYERLSNTTHGGGNITVYATTNASPDQIANSIGWALKTQY